MNTETAGPGTTSDAQAGPPAPAGLHIRDLRKRYGDTRALDGLDIDAVPGRVLGIAGPNGAGKSTLIKILAGETDADSGEIALDGAAWSPRLDRNRVAVVHQEPQLFPNLSVGDNVMVGREGTRALRRDLDDGERSLMADLAILEYRDRALGSVPLAIQQRVEIGRALARDARLFLFDEPNSALTPEESSDLFGRMHALAAAGRVVLLVSHRIAELAEHADSVALIVDGRVVAELAGDALTQENIASGLVVAQGTHGQREQEAAAQRVEHGAPVLRLSQWSHADGEFEAIDLEARAGTITALVGVEGSGARELVRSMAGFDRATGHIEVDGQTGQSAVTAAVSFVSADRQTSLFSNLSVRDNMISRLSREITTAGGALRSGRMTRIAEALRHRFRVKVESVHVPVRSLSGGNQQKVAIAAAIVKRPNALVLEEPTRGVDIGSKREIYRLLREYASEGHAVIIFCTEVPEVFEVADLAHVVSDGRLSDALSVSAYPDVEALARAITRLERHGATAALAAVS